MDILLVDDHPIVHETLGAIVRSIVPEATIHNEADLDGALACARRIKRFELVLLDLGLPGCTGIDSLVRFLKAHPQAKVVVFSADEEPARIRAALAAGAAGFVPKSSKPGVIGDALRLVLDGGVYIPLQAISASPVNGRSQVSMADLGLTGRQADVLRLVVQGLSNFEIAKALDIAENTVKQHAHFAYRILGVSSRTEAIAALARLGVSE